MGRTVRRTWRTVPPKANMTNHACSSIVSFEVNQDRIHESGQRTCRGRVGVRGTLRLLYCE
jgi:hypothetical protein